MRILFGVILFLLPTAEDDGKRIVGFFIKLCAQFFAIGFNPESKLVFQQSKENQL